MAEVFISGMIYDRGQKIPVLINMHDIAVVKRDESDLLVCSSLYGTFLGYVEEDTFVKKASWESDRLHQSKQRRNDSWNGP